MILIIGILVLTACAPASANPESSSMNTASDKENAVDPLCPTGTTAVDVPVNDLTTIDGSISAQIVHPNEGCLLPVMYCISTDIPYGGGVSCNILGYK